MRSVEKSYNLKLCTCTLQIPDTTVECSHSGLFFVLTGTVFFVISCISSRQLNKFFVDETWLRTKSGMLSDICPINFLIRSNGGVMAVTEIK